MTILKAIFNMMGTDLAVILELNVYDKTVTYKSVSGYAISDVVVNVHLNTISNVELSEIVQSYSDMFKTNDNDELNCAKECVQKMKVNGKIISLQQKLRRLLFSARDKIGEELKRLEHLSIIDKIYALEWVSPIVVTWKTSDRVSLCVDLR